MKKFIKENSDGLKILMVFVIILVLGLSGGFDFIFDKVVIPIFSGLHNSNPNYNPGESYPY